MSPTNSIFDKQDYWTSKNPEKLLYSFLDLNGSETESYTYEAFRYRTKVIAWHLRKENALKSGERVLLVFQPGLEMICAFIGCARAGLIPVPVYPPSSHGFQSALYKMNFIAKDCDAAAVLTSKDYNDSLSLNLSKNNLSRFSFNLGHVLALRWLVSEDFIDQPQEENSDIVGDILFLQYTSGSTSHPKGVMVSHRNILHNCNLVVDHPTPVAVTWLPQYHDMGLIGYYLFSAFLSGGTTYGFSPTDFIQRPSLWLETIKKYQATGSSAPNFAFEYCLRPGRLSKEAIQNADLSSLRFLMAAAEPIKPDTYSNFLQMFQPAGLQPKYFFVAYGLAENTLAVSNYGRDVLSLNKNGLAMGRVKVSSDVSENGGAKKLISCGRPLNNIAVRIVDPEKCIALEDGNVGEIWVTGESKCSGYWNKPELSREVFHARLIGDSQRNESYLRTGDLGFIFKGELYVCGRAKDTIIIRGQNYYPQDIETIVESTSNLLRKDRVVAFEISQGDETSIAVVAETRNRQRLAEPNEIITAIRNHFNVEVALIAIIAPRQIPRTSSGKIMRHMVKQMWMEGKFTVLKSFVREKQPSSVAADPTISVFEMLKSRYKLTGNEPYTLVEAGLDSLDLVISMHEVKEMLKVRNKHWFARQVDLKLIQRITIADLFQLGSLVNLLNDGSGKELVVFLNRLYDQYCREERELMRRDSKLFFEPVHPTGAAKTTGGTDVLLTGGTGFLGPFLLSSLLEQTDKRIYVLIRRADELAEKERLKINMSSAGLNNKRLLREYEKRVIPVCGDLEKENLGLSTGCWELLVNKVNTVYHNGAAVNYVFNYARMRPANVLGTSELLRLSFEGCPKVFNHVSTTFIFGWAVKEVLYETDSNENMELLDFGYSQSKWVAERLVQDATARGLMTRIFRPALVTPSIDGGGHSFDIAIRLLVFMIKHGIGVDALNQVSFVPVDVVADNIVAISTSSDIRNGIYHVTRDSYANMADITNIITDFTGRRFELFTLPDFVSEVIKRCQRDDLLFPLLDFLVGSVSNISSMEFKRYDSTSYRTARDKSKYGRPDPSLEDTVLGILRFMQKMKLIRLAAVV